MNNKVAEPTLWPVELAKEPLVGELLESCPDAIELFDLDGVILYLNGAAARRQGKSADELLGASIWDLYSVAQATHRKTVVNRAAASGLPIQFTGRRGDQWEEVLICPIRGVSGKVERIATYTRDISPQIRAEEQLKLMTLQLLTIQEDERRRIAQDLHDDIGQIMTALILNLKTIQGGIASGRADVGDQVKETIRNVEDMMRHVRQVFYELRPPSLTAQPLAKTLETLCSSLALSTGLRVDFSSQEQLPPIPDVQATVLYRLIQEGVNNVVKHAKATSVWINLEYVDGEMNISLEDDGQGFDPRRRVTYGMGLQGIRERFFMLSGNLDIESAPGKGTRLYGSLPIPKLTAG
ncbi:MAG: PAS domain S-box protein [Chloroflexi bacterium]|nr:PAS domain S-box protein [Chloroflexota bacterium]